jgi:hypothetical protein
MKPTPMMDQIPGTGRTTLTACGPSRSRRPEAAHEAGAYVISTERRAVAAVDPTERISGQTIIRIRA